MLWKAAAAVALAVALPGAAPAASPPWCGSDAVSASERTICRDPVLSRLDLELNEAYDAARRVAPVAGQRRWLAERDRCGVRLSCLERAYRSRIAELRDLAVAGSGNDRWQRPGVPDQRPRAADGAYAPPDGEPGAVPDDMLAMLDLMTPRPWCGAARLNPTERTICADRDLSRMDALLELVYGRAAARDEDRAQVAWLRSQRDACGADRLCIAQAYAARLEQLDDASIRADVLARP